MATEASKTKSFWGPKILTLLEGSGIDIGCGPDPILPGVRRFDQEHGDANRVSAYVNEKFDFVFSSHCLEHMKDPVLSLADWWSLVKPGGHLIILVPDEDLYEQGTFPSIFNSDHKNTFTISKAKSWSARSHNVFDLAKNLRGEIISLELQDFGYDRSLMRSNPTRLSRKLGRYFRRIAKSTSNTAFRVKLAKIFYRLGATVDQTDLGDVRLAQIQLILRKPLS